MYLLQGHLGVLNAIYKFVELGYEVCEPICDAYGYDLLVRFGDEYKKIQVKTSNYSPYDSGSLQYGLHKTSHNNSKIISEAYSENEVDYFYLYSPTYPSKGCLVPFGIVNGKQITINYNDEQKQSKQKMWYNFQIPKLEI